MKELNDLDDIELLDSTNQYDYVIKLINDLQFLDVINYIDKTYFYNLDIKKRFDNLKHAILKEKVVVNYHRQDRFLFSLDMLVLLIDAYNDGDFLAIDYYIQKTRSLIDQNFLKIFNTFDKLKYNVFQDYLQKNIYDKLKFYFNSLDVIGLKYCIETYFVYMDYDLKMLALSLYILVNYSILDKKILIDKLEYSLNSKRDIVNFDIVKYYFTIVILMKLSPQKNNLELINYLYKKN